MMTNLTSAAVPPIGAGDHVRGDGPEILLYMDLACPRCALTWERARELRLTICVRHFPIASKRPRARALHLAAEAAATQRADAFWLFWDGLFADRGRQDDPHLWELARHAGLDLDRFETDRRSERASERIKRDLHGGIRAGVVATPAAFADGIQLERDLDKALSAYPARGSAPG